MTSNSLSTNASKNVSLLVSLVEVDRECYDAFNYGSLEEALRLLKQIKNPRTVKNKNNFTLLHCAAYHGWLDVVKQLISEHQFDPDCADDDGNTPLSKARSNGKQSVVDYLETVIGIFVVYFSLCTFYNLFIIVLVYNIVGRLDDKFLISRLP